MYLTESISKFYLVLSYRLLNYRGVPNEKREIFAAKMSGTYNEKRRLEKFDTLGIMINECTKIRV